MFDAFSFQPVALLSFSCSFAGEESWGDGATALLAQIQTKCRHQQEQKMVDGEPRTKLHFWLIKSGDCSN